MLNLRFQMDGAALLKAWRALSNKPLGTKIFARIVAATIPYTGSIGAEVRRLEKGRATVELVDRRAIRNHLGSVHAVALANLGEFTTGLALVSALPPDARAILKRLEIDFLKKARGRLRAEAQVPEISSNQKSEHSVEAGIRNAKDEEVARVRAVWVVGPNTR